MIRRSFNNATTSL
jgi:dCMP deaminase